MSLYKSSKNRLVFLIRGRYLVIPILLSKGAIFLELRPLAVVVQTVPVTLRQAGLVQGTLARVGWGELLGSEKGKKIEIGGSGNIVIFPGTRIYKEFLNRIFLLLLCHPKELLPGFPHLSLIFHLPGIFESILIIWSLIVQDGCALLFPFADCSKITTNVKCEQAVLLWRNKRVTVLQDLKKSYKTRVGNDREQETIT